MRKKLYFLLVVLLGITMFCGTTNAQWVEQNSGTTVNLISISAPTYQAAWVAGPSGTVKRTTDNGTTWVDKSIPGTADLWSIYALDANIAFAIGFTEDWSQTAIFRTTDGGQNWTKVLGLPYGPEEWHFLDALSFFNNNEGIAYGDPVWYSSLNKAYWDVYKTSDGGLTWTAIAYPPEQLGNNYGWKNAITCIGNNVYFGTTLFDDNFNFGPDARIYKSADKGETWTYSVTPGVVQVNTIQFLNAMTGYACGAKTTDGGETWFQMNDPYKGDVNKFILSATAFGNEVWVTGIHRNGPNYFNDKWFNYRKIYYSDNGGMTWKKDYEATDAGFNEVRISRDNMALYALKDNGGIIMKMLPGATSKTSQNNNTYTLKDNYPNPFNPTTTISYQIPKNEFVTIRIYDMTGREVASLVNETKTAGTYNVIWNASGLSSGIYFYKLQAGSFTEVKKMTLVK